MRKRRESCLLYFRAEFPIEATEIRFCDPPLAVFMRSASRYQRRSVKTRPSP